MEQSGNVSSQEREGYIGLYRLLNQIDQSDGAVVGAVLETGRSMTLGNLLTAARTIKGKGVDARVDDTFGGLEELSFSRKTITGQIEQGFQGGSQKEHRGEDSSRQDDSDKKQETGYYQRMATEVFDEITPDQVHQISDGDIEEMLNQTLETFREKQQQMKSDPQVEQELYRQLADSLRETMEQSEEAVRYLGQMEIPDTVENIQAAERFVQEGYDVYRESSDRRKRLGDRQQQWKEVLGNISESMEDEESLSAACEQAEQMMEQMLNQSYNTPGITFEELQELKQLGQGIYLQNQMRHRHSYEIPLETGDTITSLNVTLIQGGEDTGKVQIFLPETEISQGGSAFTYGKVFAEFRISQGEVKGLVLCDDRTGYEELSHKKADLEADMTEQGFTVKNISYGMDRKLRTEVSGSVSQENVPTAQLYQLAKTALSHIVNTVKEVQFFHQ
jgi:hypothetical protein